MTRYDVYDPDYPWYDRKYFGWAYHTKPVGEELEFFVSEEGNRRRGKVVKIEGTVITVTCRPNIINSNDWWPYSLS